MKKEKLNGKIVIRISILWMFVLAIILTILVAFFRNFIFATNIVEDEEEWIEPEQEVNIEPNDNTVDILKLIVENNYSNKKLINEKRKIVYEVKKENDNQIPKGEEVVKTKGKDGTRQVTVLQNFENGTYVEEQEIESIITKEPVTEIIHVGTSEFLAKYKVHIGDDMYLSEKTDLKKEPKDDSETVTTFNRYLNFEILQVSEKWTKVKYDSYEGYLPNDKLTSEAITPVIKEKNRIAQLQASVNKEMDVSKPSGLTLSDFKTILGYNKYDKNEIFSQNAEYFYEAEKKYKVNGVFLAAIGIHESGWGNSYLAKEKKNLFGYRAYDRDPINSAQSFETYEDSINTVAEALAKNYLTPTGSYYNGTTVESVNIKYATSKNWHEDVYTFMEYLYGKLG